MSLQAVPVASRYAIIAAIVAGLGAMISGLITLKTRCNTGAMAVVNEQCQDDIRTQIVQLQDYFAAKNAEQAAGQPRSPGEGASSEEKMAAIKAFKSRCPSTAGQHGGS